MLTSSVTAAVYDPGSDSGVRLGREEKQQKTTPLIEYRYATRADIIKFHGEPHRGTIKAFAVLMDGEVHGFIGIVREGPIGKFFTEHSDELQPHLKSITIMRALLASLDWCRAYRGPVVAIATTAQSCMTMSRLGFVHLGGTYYGWFDKWHK